MHIEKGAVRNTFLLTKILRNLFLRNKPFFAHFLVTKRCNLRCNYCRAWKSKTGELSTDEAERVIDRLVDMGIAYLHFTGGEPLLRRDIFHLIDYASDKGLYVQITSNGTLDFNLYQELIHTNADRITISFDGVGKKGSEKILRNMRYISRNKNHLQFLSATCVITDKNKSSLEQISETCSDSGFPVLLQPVVTGDGELREKTPLLSDNFRLDLGFYFGNNVLNPLFFLNPKSNGWNCSAGELFFAIQPNGDFWLCQDIPFDLNILDKDFGAKWKRSKNKIRAIRDSCEGCTYACYYMTQRLFNVYPFFDLALTFCKNNFVKIIKKHDRSKCGDLPKKKRLLTEHASLREI